MIRFISIVTVILRSSFYSCHILCARSLCTNFILGMPQLNGISSAVIVTGVLCFSASKNEIKAKD
jgi:hypothetical protein